MHGRLLKDVIKDSPAPSASGYESSGGKVEIELVSFGSAMHSVVGDATAP
jgi:hypothetical protein